MLKLSHPITSINGFKIGDKVRLKDGDGRPHIIQSFSIDGIKEFFFEVQFEDGTETMLNNIAPLPSSLDEAAEKATEKYVYNEGGPFPHTTGVSFLNGFKAGAEWMAGQEKTVKGYVSIRGKRSLIVVLDRLEKFKFGDEVIVQIRKKQ